MKVCAEPGCPTLTPTTRCPDHTRARNVARGTATNRGYGAAHRAARADAVARIAAGGHVTCWRCGQPITNANDMHIGHDDRDRRITRGPEHATKCNLRAAGLARHGLPTQGG